MESSLLDEERKEEADEKEEKGKNHEGTLDGQVPPHPQEEQDDNDDVGEQEQEEEQDAEAQAQDLLRRLEDVRRRRRECLARRKKLEACRVAWTHCLSASQGRWMEGVQSCESAMRRRSHLERQVEEASQMSPLDDVFYIWFVGPYATMNNLRVGSEIAALPSSSPASPSNSAWGNSKTSMLLLSPSSSSSLDLSSVFSFGGGSSATTSATTATASSTSASASSSTSTRKPPPHTNTADLRVPRAPSTTTTGGGAGGGGAYNYLKPSWPEVNGALGLCVLLLTRLQAKSQGLIEYRHVLKPRGHQSQVGMHVATASTTTSAAAAAMAGESNATPTSTAAATTSGGGLMSRLGWRRGAAASTTTKPQTTRTNRDNNNNRTTGSGPAAATDAAAPGTAASSGETAQESLSMKKATSLAAENATETTTSDMNRTTTVTWYNLNYAEETSFSFLFARRNFNMALVLFVQCLEDAWKVVRELDPTLTLPYAIEVSTIEEWMEPGAVTVGGLDVIFPGSAAPVSAQEDWTRAMKYVLTNLKWLVAFMVKHVET